MNDLAYNYVKIIEFKDDEMVQQTILEYLGECSYYEHIRGISKGFKQHGYTVIDYYSASRILQKVEKKSLYTILLLGYNQYGMPIFDNRSLSIIPGNLRGAHDHDWLEPVKTPTTQDLVVEDIIVEDISPPPQPSLVSIAAWNRHMAESSVSMAAWNSYMAENSVFNEQERPSVEPPVDTSYNNNVYF